MLLVRDYVAHMASEVVKRLVEGGQIETKANDAVIQRVRLRMASIHASQQARQVAETSYLAAGATAVFESNPFERRFRDMHAVSQQAQAQFAIYEVIGRHFLGLPLETSRFF